MSRRLVLTNRLGKLLAYQPSIVHGDSPLVEGATGVALTSPGTEFLLSPATELLMFNCIGIVQQKIYILETPIGFVSLQDISRLE
jgi:hypothetical protein